MTASHTLARSLPHRLVPLAAAGLALAAATFAQEGQDGWLVLPLPAPPTESHQPAALLDGRHLLGPSDELRPGKDLGEPLPRRLAEDVVMAAVRDVGGGTVVPLDGALMVRGAAAAREAARASLSELQGQLDALRFDVGVRLLAAPDEEPLIDRRRTMGTGDLEAFGRRERRAFVHGFDIEVATDVATASPNVGTALTGATVHLWTSTVLVDGARRLHVQGLLDLAELTELSRFDTGLLTLGALEHPVVESVQVLFSGLVPADGPLRLEVALGPDGSESRTLEIDARPAADPRASDQVVDLARGLWRERLRVAHTLVEAEPPAARPGATPASLAQVHARQFADRKALPPRSTESLLLGAAERPGEAKLLRRLNLALDPVSAPRTVSVAWEGFRASVPAMDGALVRVARTRETTVVRRYFAQVANEAALCEPEVERVMTGTVVEGVVRDGVLHGRGHRGSMEVDRVHAPESGDSGRLELPVRSDRSFPLLLRSGRTLTPEPGLTITWGSAER